MSTVLLVEDAAEIVLLTEVLLSTLDDVQVVVATDGLTGLALALQLVPDLVLLDLTLPRMSGGDVLAKIRASSRTFRSKVVLFTGATHLTDAELLALGADAVLHKPFAPDALLGCVERMLALQVRT